MSPAAQSAVLPLRAVTPFPCEETRVDRSSLISRNVTICDHRTSVRLEPDMWSGLREICRREHATMHVLCTHVAAQKPANSSLTAAIRVFIMNYFRAAATEDGHSKAGHGPGGFFLSARPQFRPAGLSSPRMQPPMPMSRMNGTMMG